MKKQIIEACQALVENGGDRTITVEDKKDIYTMRVYVSQFNRGNQRKVGVKAKDNTATLYVRQA